MTVDKLCKCGGTFHAIPGLAGSFCNKCNAWTDSVFPEDTTLSNVYNIERIKNIRGLPITEITIGSESKGRIKISMPAYATEEESKKIIDMNLELLRYTKQKIEDAGIDIYVSRGKKDE